MLRRLIARVEVNAVDEYDPDYPVPAPHDMTMIQMKDGRRLETGKVRRSPGHADLPLETDRLAEKFMDCARFGGVDEGQADALFTRLQRLATLPDEDALMIVR